MNALILLIINFLAGIAGHLLKPLSDEFRPGASNIIRYTMGSIILLVLLKPVLDRVLDEKIPLDDYVMAATMTATSLGCGVIVAYITDPQKDY